MEVTNPNNDAAYQPKPAMDSAAYQSPEQGPPPAEPVPPTPVAPPPPPVYPPAEPRVPTVTIGDWFIVCLLMAIPIVNFIMLLVWAFGGGANPNKANFAKASLIWMLIGLVVMILFWTSLFATIVALISGLG